LGGGVTIKRFFLILWQEDQKSKASTTSTKIGPVPYKIGQQDYDDDMTEKEASGKPEEAGLPK
jgi:hypothetical protein